MLLTIRKRPQRKIYTAYLGQVKMGIKEKDAFISSGSKAGHCVSTGQTSQCDDGRMQILQQLQIVNNRLDDQEETREGTTS